MSNIPPRTDIPRASGPPKNKAPLLIGAALAGAVGYYFYTAGGDSHVAKKAAERIFLHCHLVLLLMLTRHSHRRRLSYVLGSP